jgi:NADH-quinone oxidoreductase subunit M
MDPNNVIVTFPELLIWLPLIGGIVAFMLKDQRAKNWALFSSIITFGVSLACLYFSSNEWVPLQRVSYVWLPGLGSSFTLQTDGLSRLLCLLNALAFPIAFVATSNNHYQKANGFYGLMLLMQSGLMGVFCTMDALAFYFFWELALIPAYFLCSIWGGERRIAATFKFFIYTFVGSLFLLVGIIFVYLHTPNHSFQLTAFYSAELSPAQQNLAFWLFFIAFAIKMPIFPLHTWQPDTYEQAPTAVTMILSGVMVKMGIYALLRWLVPVFPEAVRHFDKAIIILSIIGMLYASCIAIVQDDLKRLVAYSSIAHIGLMSAAVFSMNFNGLQGVAIQMFNHGINIIGMWVVVELIERQLGTRKISALGGLAQKAPVLAILLVVVALANIALPLTNAFVGEFLMFNGLFQFSKWYTAFAGLSIILAAVYTLNMIQRVFYGDTNSITEKWTSLAKNEAIILSVVVVLIFMVGAFPKPMFDLTRDAIASIMLFAGAGAK